MSTENTKKSWLRRWLIPMIIGAIFGYSAIWLLDNVVGVDIKAAMQGYSTAQLLAMLMSVLFVLIAVILLALSFSAKALSANLPDGEELDEAELKEMTPMLRLSALAMSAYAVILWLLSTISGDVNGSSHLGHLLIIAVMVAVQLGVNILLWIRHDELYKAIMRETAGISYILIEMIIILWAAASIFGFGISFNPLDVVLVMLSVYFVVGTVVSVRRGFA
ncbi:hypothetical protein [Sphingorhabdus sp. Alg239-R122]|uniref:hypothetical protein n=1 Tax=Sphingorhabdus sp. Alg239-R122 TaxID=2305989 RepID=UPI0013DC349C|nr:hypothetical protein [Sphingorhabdus sp. Alg239-R122]